MRPPTACGSRMWELHVGADETSGDGADFPENAGSGVHLLVTSLMRHTGIMIIEFFTSAGKLREA